MAAGSLTSARVATCPAAYREILHSIAMNTHVKSTVSVQIKAQTRPYPTASVLAGGTSLVGCGLVGCGLVGGRLMAGAVRGGVKTAMAPATDFFQQASQSWLIKPLVSLSVAQARFRLAALGRVVSPEVHRVLREGIAPQNALPRQANTTNG